MHYKYNQRAGALNEVAPAQAVAARQRVAPAALAQSASNVSDDDYRETTGLHSLYALQSSAMPRASAAAHAQTVGGRGIPPPPPHRSGAVNHRRIRGAETLFYFTVNAGERVRVIHKNGHITIVDGPKRFWKGSARVEYMEQHVAHPGEFLILRFRDGRQEHVPGPATVWLNPTEHLTIEKEDALQIAAKEAVVVYSRSEDGDVARRVVHGPATFIPEPGEWLHTFSWHGSKGGDSGYQKVPNALVFQKLWFLPDQMYHDVSDVRTADDAVLTIKLMIFFELIDLPKMLDSTHDPIGDFVNAATSDVIDFTGRHDFESFKRHTDRLNELGTYAQLTSRAEQCGYRINKVVYRGYGAPESLQRMHDEAIESRTRLQLDRATQQQAQDLEDFKLERELLRAARLRTEREAATGAEILEREKRLQSDLADGEARRKFEREERERDEAQAQKVKERWDEGQRRHLGALREMGVDLTKLLTQNRADRVIELRGGPEAHLHLDAGKDS